METILVLFWVQLETLTPSKMHWIFYLMTKRLIFLWEKQMILLRENLKLWSFKEHFSKFQNILILVKLLRWKCVPLLVSCIYVVCMDIKLIFFSATKQVLQSLVQFSPETKFLLASISFISRDECCLLPSNFRVIKC